MYHFFFANSVAAVSAWGVSFVLMPLIIAHARKHGWYDHQSNRKIHVGQVPRIGGLAIYIAFMASFTILLIAWPGINLTEAETRPLKILALLTSLSLVHFAGLYDDFKSLRPLIKLIAQVVAALVIVGSGHYFSTVYLPFVGNPVELGPSGPALTVFWLVGISNALNLMDGMDALAGGISLIAAVCFGIAGTVMGFYITGIASFALAGAVVGFLYFNMPPARIFMGDSGSLFLGILLGALPLFEPELARSLAALPMIATLLMIPIFDTLAAIIRRLVSGKPIHAPDKHHLHHKLLAYKLRVRQVLLIIGGTNLLIGACVIFYAMNPGRLSILLIQSVWLVVAAGFLLLDRLYHKRFNTGNK